MRFDVIVCGGGSAGVAAAYGSAKAGAQTLLLERLGFCGGTPVAAGIHTLDAVCSCRETTVPVVGGFARHLADELTAMGGMATADNPDEALSIHPEFMKVAIDRLLVGAGVDIIYNADVIGAQMDGHTIIGIEASLMDGRGWFFGDVFIVSSGV
jgi:flavin-dependent dehydrogenase